jgi:hypothetical protein
VDKETGRDLLLHKAWGFMTAIEKRVFKKLINDSLFLPEYAFKEDDPFCCMQSKRTLSFFEIDVYFKYLGIMSENKFDN